FASRRRHTRFSRDWSSDVCSSDLLANEVHALGWALVCREVWSTELYATLHGLRRDDDRQPQCFRTAGLPRSGHLAGSQPYPGHRSEERRVGKNGGLGGGRQMKKKD